jgi:hypothetical protein
VLLPGDRSSAQAADPVATAVPRCMEAVAQTAENGRLDYQWETRTLGDLR